MDMTAESRADWERRRKIRLAQVRDQSKAIAKKIRDRVHHAVEDQYNQQKKATTKNERELKSLAVSKLKSDFNYLVQDVGNGYSAASIQPDPKILIAEKQLINRYKAISRGVEAEKRQIKMHGELLMDKEMKERRTHFNKTVEKIRSTLITSVPLVKNINNQSQNINKHNKCIFIPSQVTMNESNFINLNLKKIAKPWSMVIDSQEKQNLKHDHSTMYYGNKENEPKFKNLQTEVKNYKTLISELNKLSAEEYNIRNKLSVHNWEEVPVSSNSVHSLKHRKDEQEKIARVNHMFIKNVQLNEKQHPISVQNLDESTSSSSIYKSSSASPSIKQPVKPTKKNICFENTSSKTNVVQSSVSKSNNNIKTATDKPLRNINNTLQRIKKKKKLLAKEISDNAMTDCKKSKIMAPDPTVSTLPKRSTSFCTTFDSLRNQNSVNLAKLPDSFYNDQLNTLKEELNKKKTKENYNPLINVDLMKYISILLKMTPRDVDNLSTSSCSSVNIEESILQHSNKTTQYYSELLKCISKCLNVDLSELSPNATFDSPNNIKYINRLQEITNYYLEKTHEMKNICEESSPNYNKQNIEIDADHFQGPTSLNVSSNSSIDGEYILGHLNTLLQKKGLIKSGKEWPMFENVSDDDRSLTDQLLDIYPHRSNGN